MLNYKKENIKIAYIFLNIGNKEDHEALSILMVKGQMVRVTHD